MPLLAVFAAVLALAPTASAANLIVEDSGDGNPATVPTSCTASDSCTLRQAVNLANGTTFPSTTADTITFAPSITSVTLSGSGPSGEIVVMGPLTIDGGGTVTVNGSPTGAAILGFQGNQSSATTNTVQNITLQGVGAGTGLLAASSFDFGSSSFIANTVNVDHATVQNNTNSNNPGGGLEVSGTNATLNVSDSTVASNQAPTGAGIEVGGSGALNVSRTTIANNTVGSQGNGIFIDSSAGPVSIVNSTISGNGNSTAAGAAIDQGATSAPLTLSYDTIADNTASATAPSAAIELGSPAHATLKGNIITANTPAGCHGSAAPASLGFNFFADATACGTGGSDHPGTSITLGPLQNNGGPTFTQALPPGSPAIDAGGVGDCTSIDGASLTTDQRGVSRPQGSACDSGAFEAVVTFTLTALRSGTGSGSVTSQPSGINCGSACSHAFDAGTQVTLTATPKTGSRFAGWSGGGCSGTGKCIVTMNAAVSVQATFNAIPPPNTAITGASISSANRKATFSFKGSGGVGALHFQCKLDSGGWTSCTSPKIYSRLARGSHTFKVRAIDTRGKADPTPVTRTFKI